MRKRIPDRTVIPQPWQGQRSLDHPPAWKQGRRPPQLPFCPHLSPLTDFHQRVHGAFDLMTGRASELRKYSPFQIRGPSAQETHGQKSFSATHSPPLIYSLSLLWVRREMGTSTLPQSPEKTTYSCCAGPPLAPYPWTVSEEPNIKIGCFAKISPKTGELGKTAT